MFFLHRNKRLAFLHILDKLLKSKTLGFVLVNKFLTLQKCLSVCNKNAHVVNTGVVIM